MKYTFIHLGIRQKLAQKYPDLRGKKFFRLRSPLKLENVIKNYANKNSAANRKEEPFGSQKQNIKRPR